MVGGDLILIPRSLDNDPVHNNPYAITALLLSPVTDRNARDCTCFGGQMALLSNHTKIFTMLLFNGAIGRLEVVSALSGTYDPSSGHDSSGFILWGFTHVAPHVSGPPLHSYLPIIQKTLRYRFHRGVLSTPTPPFPPVSVSRNPSPSRPHYPPSAPPEVPVGRGQMEGDARRGTLGLTLKQFGADV